MSSGVAQGLPYLLQLQVHEFGQLFCSRLTLVFLQERALRLGNLIKVAYLIERKTYHPALVGKTLQNALTDPPDRIGDEFEALGRVKLPGSLHQADIAVIDKVAEIQAVALILLGHAHHKAQVGFYQALKSPGIPLLDLYCELCLLIRRNHRIFVDVRQILVDGQVTDRHGLCDLQLLHVK